jgi:seryl-tRNA synthetase
MLDIKFIKENKDIVAAAIKNRNRELDLDELLNVYEERKDLRKKIDETNQKRNEAARERNIEIGSQLKKDLEELEKKFAEVDKKYVILMLKVPNIPSPDTPVGRDESQNKVIRQWGEKPVFKFEPKEHHELGVALGILDTDTAGEISGSRFAYIKGDLALLQFAILQFYLGVFTDK